MIDAVFLSLKLCVSVLTAEPESVELRPLLIKQEN